MIASIRSGCPEVAKLIVAPARRTAAQPTRTTIDQQPRGCDRNCTISTSPLKAPACWTQYSLMSTWAGLDVTRFLAMILPARAARGASRSSSASGPVPRWSGRPPAARPLLPGPTNTHSIWLWISNSTLIDWGVRACSSTIRHCDDVSLELRRERPTTTLLPSHGLHDGHPSRGSAPDGGCPISRRSVPRERGGVKRVSRSSVRPGPRPELRGDQHLVAHVPDEPGQLGHLAGQVRRRRPAGDRFTPILDQRA